METIDLLTSNGDPVAKVAIPVFNEHPEIILWGSRYFKRHDINETNRFGFEYREAFTVAAMVTIVDPPAEPLTNIPTNAKV